MRIKTETIDEIASRILADKLLYYKTRVDDWILDIAEQEPEAAESMKKLYQLCHNGIMETVTSISNIEWLCKVIEKANHVHGLRTIFHEGKAYHYGVQVGMWIYQAKLGGQKYDTITYKLDPAFLQEYMGVDATLLASIASDQGY